jgi:hypothetical protein
VAGRRFRFFLFRNRCLKGGPAPLDRPAPRTHKAGHDAFGTGGDVYERAIRKAIGELKSKAAAQTDPHKPGFDWRSIPFHNYHMLPDFHKRLEEIRAAKPLTPWQQSSNEIHDHRVVDNDVNIHIAGQFPVEKTDRPLSRPRRAIIRLLTFWGVHAIILL